MPTFRATSMIPRLLLVVFVYAAPAYSQRACGVIGTVVAPGFAWDKYVEVLQVRNSHLMGYTYTDRKGDFTLPSILGDEDYDIVIRIDGYADYRERIIAYGCRTTPRTFYMERDPAYINPFVLDLTGEVQDVVDIRELRRKIPPKLVAEFEKAKKERTENKVARAFERLHAIVKSAPDFYEAHNVLGTLYLEMKKFREAEAEYNKAHDLRPRSPAPLVSLGSLYLQEAEAASGADPERSFVLVPDPNLGLILDDARSVLLDAVKISPSTFFAHYLLGIVAYKTADYKTGEGNFRKALDVEPRLRWARLALANIYMREARWKDALAELDAYIADFPKVLNHTEVRAARDKVAARLAATQSSSELPDVPGPQTPSE